MFRIFHLLILSLAITCFSSAADKKERSKSDSEETEMSKEEASEKESPAYEPKVSEGEARIGGSKVKYTTKTGMMPILDDDGEVKAEVFFVYYAAESKDSIARPVTFCFNGGPGSSAVWLHLGGLGPKRVDTLLDGRRPEAIAPIVDNADSILDATDLVFIDPVQTGLSRAVEDEEADQFHGVDEDIESVSEFIRQFCSQEERWASPKFLCGESYGGIRAAGLADHLQQKHGIYMNGILIVSGLLNYQTLMPHIGNDLPFILYLPAYTATAHYHKKLSPELQKDFDATMQQSRDFAFGDYSLALLKGTTLSDTERTEIAQRLSELTGIDADVIDDHDLRIRRWLFRRMLLKEEGLILGGYDARVVGDDGVKTQTPPEFDPSASFVKGAVSAAINHYVRSTLGYESDHPYNVMARLKWRFAPFTNRYVSMEERLASAMKENPAMQILIMVGLRDIVVSEDAMRYSIDHLPIPDSLRSNIKFVQYQSGHMMYFEKEDAQKFRTDALEFIKNCLPQ
ncbi:MAG: S10 family peptidase [Opitutaceae bacterium]